MTFLFVAYCFGSYHGQSLIGVYKRALRVALELEVRGHRVALLCPGRDGFEDDMTARAEQRLELVDWPFEPAELEGVEINRQRSIEELRTLAPDVVVIGEAPLAGALLELTLCAVELRIPVVCLDNAHHPDLVEMFLENHAAMYDGLILAGPSSFHTRQPPPFLLQVPPLIEASAQRASSLVQDELDLEGRRLMTVLAYDMNALALGASIFEKLDDPELEAIFLCHLVEPCQQSLERLPAARRQRVRILTPRPDLEHFGLCQISRLVVGKCAFMQVSECLSLLTPIIGFYFEGDFNLEMLPNVCRPFTHSTSRTDADASTLDAARRFLATAPGDMAEVHDGTLLATRSAAEFLEDLPRTPRTDVRDDCAARGLTEERLLPALRHLHPRGHLEIEAMRLSQLRRPADNHSIFSIVCHYRVDTQPRCERFWARTFALDGLRTHDEARKAADPENPRQLCYVRPEEFYLIERDVGEMCLPDFRVTEETG